MDINTKNIQELREDINITLKSLSEKYGVEFIVGNCKYSENKINFDLQVLNGSEEAVAMEEFNSICELYGLKSDDFGKIITYGEEKVKITGIDTKRRKYPIKILDEKGVKRLVTVESMLKALNRL